MEAFDPAAATQAYLATMSAEQMAKAIAYTRGGYWLDFLDVPLVHLLEPMFYEAFPGGHQPVTSEPNGHPFVYSRAWVIEEIAKQPVDSGGVRRLSLPTLDYIPTIALTYLNILRQPRSAWTSEIELRPWVERF